MENQYASSPQSSAWCGQCGVRARLVEDKIVCPCCNGINGVHSIFYSQDPGWDLRPHEVRGIDCIHSKGENMENQQDRSLPNLWR